MKLLKILVAAVAMVSATEEVVTESVEPAGALDVMIKMGHRQPNRGRGQNGPRNGDSGNRGNGGRGNNGNRVSVNRGQGNRGTSAPAAVSARSSLIDEEKMPRECNGKKLSDKGNLSFNCKRTKSKMAKNGFTKVCRVKCGRNKKLLTAKTPSKIYCNKSGWVNRKDQKYDISKFGCLPPKKPKN